MKEPYIIVNVLAPKKTFKEIAQMGFNLEPEMFMAKILTQCKIPTEDVEAFREAILAEELECKT